MLTRLTHNNTHPYPTYACTDCGVIAGCNCERVTCMQTQAHSHTRAHWPSERANMHGHAPLQRGSCRRRGRVAHGRGHATRVLCARTCGQNVLMGQSNAAWQPHSLPNSAAPLAASTAMLLALATVAVGALAPAQPAKLPTFMVWSANVASTAKIPSNPLPQHHTGEC
jgi:hypothetical protein